MATITRGHVAIFELHRWLVERGLADQGTRALLDESVQIATDQAPTAARDTRQAVFDDALHRLLDPAASPVTPGAARTVERAEDRLRSFARRQQVIAVELGRRTDGGPDG